MKKQCTKCEIVISFSEFNSDRSNKTGRQSYCIECKFNANSRWRRNNSIKYNLYFKNKRKIDINFKLAINLR